MTQLLTCTPLLYQRGSFPRQNGRPYLLGEAVREALTSAVIFYLVKKDKAIENRNRHYLLLLVFFKIDVAFSFMGPSGFPRYGVLDSRRPSQRDSSFGFALTNAPDSWPSPADKRHCDDSRSCDLLLDDAA